MRVVLSPFLFWVVVISLLKCRCRFHSVSSGVAFSSASFGWCVCPTSFVVRSPSHPFGWWCFSSSLLGGADFPLPKNEPTQNCQILKNPKNILLAECWVLAKHWAHCTINKEIKKWNRKKRRKKFERNGKPKNQHLDQMSFLSFFIFLLFIFYFSLFTSFVHFLTTFLHFFSFSFFIFFIFFTFLLFFTFWLFYFFDFFTLFTCTCTCTLYFNLLWFEQTVNGSTTHRTRRKAAPHKSWGEKQPRPKGGSRKGSTTPKVVEGRGEKHQHPQEGVRENVPLAFFFGFFWVGWTGFSSCL